MGFFSGCCVKCGRSILNGWTIRDYRLPAHGWMTECVAILPDNSILSGTYDGYGRIDGNELSGLDWPELYHRKCYEAAGSPKTFSVGSPNAPDQGYFIDPDEYLSAKPWEPEE